MERMDHKVLRATISNGRQIQEAWARRLRRNLFRV